MIRRSALAAAAGILALVTASTAGALSRGHTHSFIEVGAPGTALTSASLNPFERADNAINIDWRILAGLDYTNGKQTDTLKKLDGKTVRIPGFVVPLDDFQEEGAEFLLVPYYGACVHTPPPPPNQMVYVRMQNNRKVKFGWWDPVWMEGTLKIEHFESPYGAAGFQLTGMKVTPYKA